MQLIANVNVSYYNIITRSLVFSNGFFFFPAVSCPLLSSVDNAPITYNNPGLGVNTVATYTVCDASLSLSTMGDLQRTCVFDGAGFSWSGTAPSCNRTLLLSRYDS